MSKVFMFLCNMLFNIRAITPATPASTHQHGNWHTSLTCCTSGAFLEQLKMHQHGQVVSHDQLTVATKSITKVEIPEIPINGD